MRRIYLQRWPEWPDGQGTPGHIYYGHRHAKGISMIHVCKTLELPWRDNKRAVSRIPAGTYRLEKWSSERFPKALHLRGVPGRSAILIHAGNWCGDVHMGLRSDVLGCITPCVRHGELKGQRAGLASRVALDRLLEYDPEEIAIINWPE